MNTYINTGSVKHIIARLIATKDKMIAKGFNYNDLQVSVLRSFVPLKNGESTYIFNLSSSQGNTTKVSQELLNQNDSFGISGMKLEVIKAKILGDRHYTGNSEAFGYANKSVFDGVAVNGFTENECITGVFHGGRISMKADSQEVLYGVHASVFGFTPITQADDDFVSSSNQDSQAESFFSLPEDIMISGGDVNTVTLNLQSTSTSTIEGDTEAPDTEKNYAVISAIGIIARGGSQVMAKLVQESGTNCRV